MNTTQDLIHFLRSTKRRLLHAFSRLPYLTLAIFPVFPRHLLLENYIYVRHNSLRIFRVLALGRISSWRVRTFSCKEPETLEWIESFLPGEILFDVGANIGLYSLYAAYRGSTVYAFEPSAQNFAILNVNISLNPFSSLVKAFPIACHESFCFSSINLSSMQWASALSSFDQPIDQYGEVYKPAFVQGSIGVPLDLFCNSLSLSPSHIKIDVDGNELSVLRGAVKCLSSATLKSLLVELNPNRTDYHECIVLLHSYGFLLEATQGSNRSIGANTPFNHIFKRHL